ncbi:hypothetical protein DNI29_08155 [Hymenobacter sediminis]|uniref:carboxypeptidase-like regulatory domain-containing protein n=1 Tax=Hymenobacter sediminis TaxID=2218621 RepID=UPI000DA64639|nr:carboxypeptidase-like regulatory domain-containing protein [Hymenobacter sediminis]RPD48577.1 hypothetical protein DNI29_08155 [Hymenobacter sediminis]
MNAKTTTPLETEEPALPLPHEEEEDLSSGNGRLAIIVGIIVAVVVLGYALLPTQATRRIAAAMPIMQLGEANVTGHRTPEEAKAAAATEDEVPTTAPVAAGKPAAPAAPTPASGLNAEQPLVSTEAEPVAIEPVPAAEVTEVAPATVAISGRVLDEEGQPLAGATVMLKGTRKATGTDANGNYTLEVPAGDNTLVYGYGGYEDQELKARNTQTHTVTLVPREEAPRRRRR